MALLEQDNIRLREREQALMDAVSAFALLELHRCSVGQLCTAVWVATCAHFD